MSAKTTAILVQWSGGSWYFGDITRNETHRSVLRITEHAVEAGPDITDSARRDIDRFVCEVLVSNTPIVNLNYQTSSQSLTIVPNYYKAPIWSNLVGSGVSALVSLIAGGPSGNFGGTVQQANVPFDAVSDMRSKAIWLQDTKQLLTVITPKAVYNNMLLEVSELNRGAQDGDAAPFRFEFKRVRVVQAGFTSAAAPVQPRGNPSAGKGKQGPQAKPTTPNSVAAQAAQNAGWHQAGTTFGGGS